jgi:hypothetical protein
VWGVSQDDNEALKAETQVNRTRIRGCNLEVYFLDDDWASTSCDGWVVVTRPRGGCDVKRRVLWRVLWRAVAGLDGGGRGGRKMSRMR